MDTPQAVTLHDFHSNTRHGEALGNDASHDLAHVHIAITLLGVSRCVIAGGTISQRF